MKPQDDHKVLMFGRPRVVSEHKVRPYENGVLNEQLTYAALEVILRSRCVNLNR